MRSRTRVSTERLAAFAARLEAFGEQADLTHELSVIDTSRMATVRVERALRRGAQRGPLVQLLMDLGLSRRTAYRVLRAASARIAPTPGDPFEGSAVPRPKFASPAEMGVSAALAPSGESHPQTPAASGTKRISVPAPRRMTTAPLERYAVGALPAHLTVGMTLRVASDGGSIWIDPSASAADAEAPFGLDDRGIPWAPYGRDTQGRFRTYFGTLLGVAGRTGRGRFVGEPDEP